jgi:hypothetical protein
MTMRLNLEPLGKVRFLGQTLARLGILLGNHPLQLGNHLAAEPSAPESPLAQFLHQAMVTPSASAAVIGSLSSCAGDLTGGSRNVNCSRRKSEVRVVQRIEQFPAELKRGLLL